MGIFNLNGMVPTRNRILVRPLINLNITMELEDPIMEGTIINIGPGEAEFRVGQRVFFETYSGTNITIDDWPHILMWRNNVLMYEA